MRRHLHWILLLLAVPVSYLALMGLFFWVYSTTMAMPDAEAVGWALARMALLLAAVVVPIVFLIRAIVQMARTYRRAQRAAGRYSKYELSVLDRAQRAAGAWEFARSVRGDLLSGRMPPTIQQWDVVPYPGEHFFARLTLNYARYYGQDVAYGQSSAIALGNPAFVAGVLAVSAIANASARSRAAAQATPQWREWQTTTVYVTSQRLAVHASGRWLSFEYRAITAVYPEVASATLVCQFD